MWTLLTTVLFVFPPDLPTDATSMNYAVVAFGVILVIAIVQWVFDGRKNYTGPHLDETALVEGRVEGITGTKEEASEETSAEASTSHDELQREK